MPFDQSTIASVNPPAYSGNQVWISWVPTVSGLTWQVYINRQLVYGGPKVGLWLAVPSDGVERLDIGSVDPGEISTDFGGVLAAAPARRILLGWQGGTWESPDIVGFHVYQSPTAGSPVNLTKPVADIKAYPGIVTDGFGLNGFGAGGFGQAGGDYEWITPPLTSGTWSFAIRPYDLAGNEGAAVTTSRAVNVPPLEPGLFPDGSRLHYQVDRFGTGTGFGQGGFGLTAPGSAQLTLNWLPSPG